MKMILLVTALMFGCSSKGSSASACADAVTKGVDTMMAAGQKRMEAMGGAGAEMKAKLDGAAVKLKEVITNRCTEDKWSAEIVDCYSKATSRDDLKACRAKLPAEQSAKLQTEEIQVMSQMMGGMPGGHGPRPGGMGGMGGPPPAVGSGATITPPVPEGSAK